QLLHRIHERQSALIGHPADRVAMRSAAKTVVKALFVVDREAWRLLVMKGAARLILTARARDFHRAADQRRQRDTRSQFIEPLRGEGHDLDMPTPDPAGKRGAERGFSRARPSPSRSPCS